MINILDLDGGYLISVIIGAALLIGGIILLRLQRDDEDEYDDGF